MSTVEPQSVGTADEPHSVNGMRARLNWLRAGVLGANDGIISTAGLVIGVAAATTDRTVILTAGVAGLVAGAVSMALGEYVSVSSQRDTERAMIAQERRELEEDPEGELEELAGIYRAKGLSAATARAVAQELTAIDPVKAHLDAELGLDADQVSSRADFGATLGGYSLVHLRLAWPLAPAWRLEARLENLTDRDYEMVSGYNTPGRSGVLSLVWNDKR